MKHAVTYLEFCTTAISLITLWLGIKQHVAIWYVSICISLVNMVIYYQGALYDRVIAGSISIVFSLYGWHQWLYGSTDSTPIEKITKTSLNNWLVLISSAIACGAVLNRLLVYMQSDLPYLGTLSTMLSVVGLWMSAKKKLESYIIWGCLNIVSVYIHFKKDYTWFSIKYLIYLFASVYGYYRWWKLYSQEQET